MGKGSAFVAIALALLLAVPAIAQEDERVQLTFRLTIYGEAPSDDSFVPDFESQPNAGSAVYTDDFCGAERRVNPALEEVQGSGVECEGGGRTYTYVFGGRPRRGSAIAYEFVRLPGGDSTRSEAFGRGVTTLREDTTLSAYYDYRTGEGGPGDGPGDQQGGGVSDDQQQDANPGDGDDQQATPEMPDTGAGALAGTAPQEVYCPPSSPHACAAVSTAVYLAPGDVANPGFIARELAGALGIDPAMLPAAGVR